ncbi:MAG: S8 family serine peptidase, partial [Vicinamibacterales bacterium]
MAEHPATRRLRVLAFDPSLATRLDTATINEITVEIPWEDDLCPGPIGEYIEVVDYDPASGVFYKPVDLNDPYLLAQDGLAPSESNPQFHQQMVYAVAMTTIRQFERALGRVALWADRKIMSDDGDYQDQFVRRLRIYPHALRDRNAYYSPAKKALLFGYFPVTKKDADNTPGTIVFTCLSHDIIAHEVTHALLDGVHPRFNEPSNPDVPAFHEAFADIVALFQHFSYPAVLESQIRRTRGNLDSEHLLSQLAQQFGKATSRGSALRDALGKTDAKSGAWEARKPDPRALETTNGPHARGSILVAAVFRAFLLIYRARSADLFRIATQGTGTLPEGDIHPDLTRRLAAEAAGAAERILQMCIRAIDYCPPVDITFGDFLRGVITADLDYAPEDKGGARLVFIESFREWGIYPRGVRSLGLDALAWPSGADAWRDATSQELPMHTLVELKPRLSTFLG